MPTFRDELSGLSPYVPGRSAEEITHEYGLQEAIKLSSNESPYEPFPEVVEAMRAAASRPNRYPDTTFRELRPAMAKSIGVEEDKLIFGAGGSELLMAAGLAFGGRCTSAVYAEPSFAVYEIVTTVSQAVNIPVSVTTDHRHDLKAMMAAIKRDTTLVYVCNPNNPTGTVIPSSEILDFVDALPRSVTAIVDEAYHRFADNFSSLSKAATTRENLLVLQTMSKVYGMAGSRVGVLVGPPKLTQEVRRTLLPFTVTDISQTAAVENLKHEDRIAERVRLNAIGRSFLHAALDERGIERSDSQANFVYINAHHNAEALNEALLERGTVVRKVNPPWMRITVGTERENHMFLGALDESLDFLSRG